MKRGLLLYILDGIFECLVVSALVIYLLFNTGLSKNVVLLLLAAAGYSWFVFKLIKSLIALYDRCYGPICTAEVSTANKPIEYKMDLFFWIKYYEIMPNGKEREKPLILFSNDDFLGKKDKIVRVDYYKRSRIVTNFHKEKD